MKNITLLLIVIFAVMPSVSEAGWYWLLMETAPDQSDFVELTALDYYEKDIPDTIIHPLDIEFYDLLQKAEGSVECKGKYEEAVDDFREDVVLSSVTGTYVIQKEELEYSIDSHWTKIEKCLNDEMRAIEIAEALQACDFDFFEDSMSNEERTQTWEERELCKKQSSSGVAAEDEEVIMPIIEAPVAVLAPEVPLPEPVADSVVQNVVPIRVVEDVETLEQSHATETEIQETQPEVTDDVVEERVVTTKDSKQTFVQKIVSFFKELFTF